MPSYRGVTAHLILRPAEGVFDVLVALLDPRAPAVKPDDLFQAGGNGEAFSALSVGAGKFVTRYQVVRSGKVAGSVVAITARSVFPGR